MSKQRIRLPIRSLGFNSPNDDLKMRLFEDAELSPLSNTGLQNWDGVERVITPFNKGSNSSIATEDSGVYCTPVLPSRRVPRACSTDIKRSLFADSGEHDVTTPDEDYQPRHVIKRLRLHLPDRGSNIIEAVDRLTREADLVADGSRAFALPTVTGKHRDLKSISPDTMVDVLNGCHDDKLEKVTIIDCRYPYEFEGGQIKGAINLYTKDSIQKFLHDNATSSKSHVLIFHCEFSSERGPKMYRFLRSLDRDQNKDQYPRLHFPEIYLLEGGYKAFYHQHETLCDPINYTPMLHEQHAAELRHFRVKSKSWAAGDKGHVSKRSHSSRSRLVL